MPSRTGSQAGERRSSPAIALNHDHADRPAPTVSRPDGSERNRAPLALGSHAPRQGSPQGHESQRGGPQRGDVPFSGRFTQTPSAGRDLFNRPGNRGLASFLRPPHGERRGELPRPYPPRPDHWGGHHADRHHFGFGFYSACLVRPRVYPVYYPAYVASSTYVVSAPVVENTVVVAPPVQTTVATNGSALAVPADQLKQMVTTGTQYFRDGRYNDAADLFLRVANADPQNVDAWLSYGMARFATGDYAASAEALRRGIRLFPQVVDSAMDVRSAYGNSADFDRQWDQLARRLQDVPADTDALLVVGFVYHFVGDREHAAEVFRHIKDAVAADGDIADFFLNAKPLAEATAAVGQNQRPAPTAAVERPVGAVPPPLSPMPAALFQGMVSRDSRVAGKEMLTVDGIVIKVEDTDGHPLDADLQIRVGGTRWNYEDLPIGTVIQVVGISGRTHSVQLTALEDHSETVWFAVSL
ncbi:MAG TPA: tetratricopeptide repeat protein [Phycisphaerae bacterium]|nr:tetratricopeptide repeat protein [Phycisphaerae bacterium]HRY66988.1 tetratricopeptide repeat protein [Phycisphaerae bacterium]HSA28827.1 tetratricopeptide repeat protein [Phycisphaerae bacterium]